MIIFHQSSSPPYSHQQDNDGDHSDNDLEEQQEGTEGEEEGLFDLKMRQEVKKKLGHPEMNWEEEMDEEDNAVAIKTYVCLCIDEE